MLKIAVCDDSHEDLSNILSMINDYAVENIGRRELECTPFCSAVDLLSAIERGRPYDLVLLDIIMPLTTGMDAAYEIRQFNKEVKIVFLTSSSEYAVESYSVGAYSYLLKPVGKAALYSILDRIFSEIEDKTDAWFLVKSKTGLVRVYFNKLEFAEVLGRTIVYHLTDGSALEAAGTMAGLKTLLPAENGFIKPHRSYIVNMEHIDTFFQRRVRMRSQASVPVAKANYSAVKSAYVTYSFNELKAKEIV